MNAKIVGSRDRGARSPYLRPSRLVTVEIDTTTIPEGIGPAGAAATFAGEAAGRQVRTRILYGPYDIRGLVRYDVEVIDV